MPRGLSHDGVRNVDPVDLRSTCKLVKFYETTASNATLNLETSVLTPWGRNQATAEETKAVSKINDSERLLRAYMEHSQIGVTLTRMNGRWIDANPALSEFLG